MQEQSGFLQRVIESCLRDETLLLLCSSPLLLPAFLELSQCFRDPVQVHRPCLVASFSRVVLSCFDGGPSGLCSLVHITRRSLLCPSVLLTVGDAITSIEKENEAPGRWNRA